MEQKNLMKRLMINALAIPLTLCAAQSHAGNVGVDIHLGVPVPSVVVAPRPAHHRPVPAFYFNETPEFIYSPFLRFSVAIGAPYDLFYDNNHYYIFSDGYWHRSPQLDGPWSIVHYRSLPPDFRRHKIDQIRRYRDKEFDIYRHHRPSRPDHHYSPRHERDDHDRDGHGRDYRDYREERRQHERERHHR